MQFLSIASAWFGIALPIIAAMYLLKRTYLDTQVPSHLLWRRVLKEQEANKPWQKLKARLLLLIQLLAALLIILALMDPVLEQDANDNSPAVIILDASGSMSAWANPLTASDHLAASPVSKQEKITRLDLAIQSAQDWLAAQSSSRPISLIINGEEPHLAVTLQGKHEQIADELSRTEPTYGQADHVAALLLADSLLFGKEHSEILIFTDRQWQDTDSINQLRLAANWSVIPVTESDDPFNASILYFGVHEQGPLLVTGTSTLFNDSLKDRNLSLQVTAYDDQQQEVYRTEQAVAVAAGQWQSVITKDMPLAKYYRSILLDPGDEVMVDNLAYGFGTITAPVHVLYVGEGNLFLEKALLLAGVQVIKLSPDASPPNAEQMATIDWLLLDGSKEKLEKQEEWQRILTSKPLWIISSAKEEGAATVKPSGKSLSIKDHPVTEYLTFSDTYISQMSEPSPTDVSWGSPIVTYGGVPAIIAGKVNGVSRLQFMFALQNTDLPLRAEFPVLVQQAAAYMKDAKDEQLGVFEVGEVLELLLPDEADSYRWEAVDGVFLERGTAAQYQKVTNIVETPILPGLYRLVYYNAAGTSIGSTLAAIQPHAREFTDWANPALMPLSSNDWGTTNTHNQSGDEAIAQESRWYASLTPWLAMLLLMMMVFEWEVYRRGHTG